jgi:phosphohistidine phosphatase
MTERRLYLVRHARAAERGPEWPDDRERPLTPDGIRRMERAARGLSRRDVRFDLILTSPLVRALETARILARHSSGLPRILEVAWLEPGASAPAVARRLRPYTRSRDIALVGHEPDLGHLAAWLVGATKPIPFRKGAVACFGTSTWPPRPPVTLQWFLPARMLA